MVSAVGSHITCRVGWDYQRFHGRIYLSCHVITEVIFIKSPVVSWSHKTANICKESQFSARGRENVSWQIWRKTWEYVNFFFSMNRQKQKTLCVRFSGKNSKFASFHSVKRKSFIETRLCRETLRWTNTMSRLLLFGQRIYYRAETEMSALPGGNLVSPI